MKQFERIYENIDLIIFRADYIEGRSVEVAVSLNEHDYMIHHLNKAGVVENKTDYIPIRLSKAKKFREFLKEIKLLEWPTLKLGDKGYYDAPLTFSYGYDEEEGVGIDEAVPFDAVPLETMRRIHKELENLIGTTFGSYRFYDE
ncbi:TPA: hypothetical protein ACGOYW_000653 [Streptococcus suis]